MGQILSVTRIFSEFMLLLHLTVIFSISQKRILSSLLNIERLFSGLKGVKTFPPKLDYTYSSTPGARHYLMFSGIPEFCFQKELEFPARLLA